jgi:malate dehydrogenase (oxaloacetate-decarboxylating)
MANPEPEVDPIAAAQHAAVVATGRSDFANQINNVLVFPGVFRGLLDAASTSIDEDVMLAAATALAEVVHPDELNPAYIIPSVFHPDVSKVVAAAVKAAALGMTPEAAERLSLDGEPSGASGEPELIG